MANRRYNIPSLSSLVAFEAVARLQGFARAAEELNTSQPAISRHIRNLEIRYGVEFFDRDKNPIALTSKGSQFYAGVVQGFDALQNAVQDLKQVDNSVTLVCSHSVSHLLLMPRFGYLRNALGNEAELRVMTAEYNLVQAAVDSGGDIVFEYSATAPDTEHVVVCEEKVKPVGTPEMVRRAVSALSGECEAPPLLRLQKENYGWLDWIDWWDAHPEYADWPICGEFDSYVYLLEAAASGQGLGLGWLSFIDPYLARGDLVEMPVDWHSTSTKVYARLTRFGQRNPMAQKCLLLLKGSQLAD
ncbi:MULTISPECIES: LysR family transcriptional regulator [unclassified Ruegeria]|uniref:LysR family transcriptional regulator n=1 Tax=unclassified Ruegeria TaxID=2625375 RepID=UPI001491629F|nr:MULTISPECIES: LysR family transcriptional regulator [unclassified Ruegeria]NOD35771.1 LysR family transcriptional regulator [Ruegeria sp. HKCCD7296]NOE40182.1 LysR family transcriptional regulator [Ruegeria sp. HKCCD7319]